MYVLGVFNVVAAVMLIGAPQPLLPERTHPCTLHELYIPAWPCLLVLCSWQSSLP
jgi:hypothetical protein